MKNKLHFIIAVMFIIASGLIYSIERVAVIIAGNIERAGFFAGRMSGEVPSPEMPGFGDNIFAPVFLVVGIAILAFASLKNK